MNDNAIAESLADAIEGRPALQLLWCDYPGQECETCERFLQERCEGHDPGAKVIQLSWQDADRWSDGGAP